MAAGIQGFKLSPQQRRLWRLQQAPAGAPLLGELALRFHHRIESHRIWQAVSEVVARHEILRTSFSTIPGLRDPVQVIGPAGKALEHRIERRTEAREMDAAALASLFDELKGEPFDLAREPLVRAAVMQLEEQGAVLALVIPGLLCDSRGLGILAREIALRCTAAAELAELTAEPVQYVEFADVVNEMLLSRDEEAMQGSLYWRNQDLAPVAPLALPGVSAVGQGPFQAAGRTLRLDAPLVDGLWEVARRCGADPGIVVLACWQILLWRLSGETEMVVWVAFGGRRFEGLEFALGTFQRYLPVRASLRPGMPFTDLVAGLATATREHEQWQDLFPPEEMIGEEAGGSESLFPVCYTYEEAGDLFTEQSDPTLLHRKSEVEEYLLNLVFNPGRSTFALEMRFNSRALPPPAVESMAERLCELLRSAIQLPQAQLADLRVMPESEADQVLRQLNDTGMDLGSCRTLDGLFARRVALQPDAIAVVSSEGELSYGELAGAAAWLACRLRHLGVGPETRVALCVERSAEMVLGLLAVLGAGAAYVPVDPSLPEERIAWLLNDCEARVVLTRERYRDQLRTFPGPVLEVDTVVAEAAMEEAPAESPFGRYAEPQNLAYIVYTSGSTGRPKGVMVAHSAIANRLLWMTHAFPFGADDRVLQKTAASFDASVWELLVPLFTGSRLVLAQPGGEKDSSYLVAAVQEHGITVLQLVPSMLAVMLQDPGFGRCRSLRRVFCGGEALSLGLQQHFFAALDAELVNLYGPTEVAIDATFAVCDRRQDAGPVPIGRPIANARTFLLDPALHPVLLGTVGELYVGGEGLARGYLRQPHLTAERFIPNPFAGQPGERLYRTGDLARYDSAGWLEYLGRVDQQVKIRGFRIEPLEVESALRQHHAVVEAAVLAREAPAGGRRLVAYVVAAEGAALSDEDLRDFLAAKLPDYMIPAAFVRLASLPRLPSGKLDPGEMPEPEAVRTESPGPAVAPRTPTEELLHDIWCELLHRDRCSVLDDFFEIGGHSLLAMQVLMRIREAFATEIPLRNLFEATTITALAAEVDSRRSGAMPRPPIARVERDGPLPLSFGQQRLWFLQQLEPESSSYNIPLPLRLSGTLDPALLQATLNEVVRRHEVLRTAFHSLQGVPGQTVLPASPVPIALIDLRALPEPLRQSAGRDLVRRESAWPFDLRRGSPLRLTLVRTGAEEHLALLTLHHIVSDAWSMRVLIDEVTAGYTALHDGRTLRLPELTIQYSDYAVWQRTWLSGEPLDREIAFWRAALPSPHPVLELPADRPRGGEAGTQGATLTGSLPASLSSALHQLARRHGATDFMILLAGFELLLLRHCGEEDLRVGTPIAGRDRLETERLIGFFVNTLVLRTRLDGEPSFAEALSRVRATVLEAYLHQELPFEKLVEELQPERSLVQSPLFQVLFSLQEAPREELRLPGLTVRGVEGGEVDAKFDLMLAIDRGDELWNATFTYRRELFDEVTIVRLLDHLAELLTGAASRPETPVTALPLMAAGERHQLLVEWADTAADYPRDTTLAATFAAVARHDPGATALVWGDEAMSYGELDRRSNRLAHALIRRHVRPEQIVALHLDPSPELIVGVLAILKAGAAYLPLDADAPADRLSFILGETGVAIGLTTRELAGRLPAGGASWLYLDEADPAEGEPDFDPAVRICSENLAYVMYTSGSTGLPKGVAVSHRNVLRLVRGAEYVHFGRDTTFLLMARFSFDAATFELWGALLNGARLALMPAGPPTLGELARAVDRYGVTTLWLTAGLFQQMAEERLGALSAVRELVAGGDVLSVAHVRKALADLPRTRLINGYGPTEGTTFTCCHDVRSGSLVPSVPVGRPIANTRVWLLDHRLQPVPSGTLGEIHIAGDGIVRGYLCRPDLTAERFVPDPCSAEAGSRMYRSGDLARYRDDGTLEFLGRADLQVKIRGFRIELAEIENVLLSHPGVGEAVVSALSDDSGGNRLVAYFVAAAAPEPAPLELRELLRERLPEYMVPSAFVAMERLPLSVNGKVDRGALPIPPAAVSAAGYLPPRDRLELRLVQIWEAVLGRHPIGIADDFFELGGHSLLAVRLMAQIQQQLGRELLLTSLFSGGTVEQQAVLLREGSGPAAYEALVAIQPQGSRAPLFVIHPGGGGALGYLGLAHYLGTEQPVFGLQARGWEDELEPLSTIEEMAASYLHAVTRLQPQGPYFLGGWSFGGLVAFEMAQQLRALGEDVAMVALLDSSAEQEQVERDDAELLALFLEGELPLAVDELRNLGNLDRQLAYVVAQAQELGMLPPRFSIERARRYFTVRKLNMRAAANYRPREYAGKLTLFRAAGRPEGGDPILGWGRLAAGGLEIEVVPGRHENIIHEPHVRALAERLQRILTELHEEAVGSGRRSFPRSATRSRPVQKEIL